MTITFFSNFLNIHQLPFCEELIKHIGEDNFRFVATTEMDPDRIQMGFEDMNRTKSFVVRAYENEFSYAEAKQLARESDVAIMGSAPMAFTKIRMKSNRLTFQYSERLLKLGGKVLLMPGFYRSYYNKFFKYRRKKMYVLCASAYTAPDLQHLFFPREKCFKWGYFPEMNPCDTYSKFREGHLKSKDISILWAGRLIDWKHPEIAISVAKYLKESGKSYSMVLIGDGPMRAELEQRIVDFGLSKNVILLGAQNHEVVLENMKESDIFLFTSDRNEGWGAVLNEAMNEGCAVIASDAIGSSPFLIKNGENGLLYSDGNIQQLMDKIHYLIDNKEMMRSLSDNAQKTVCNLWSIQTATENFLELINGIITNGGTPFEEGPCSKA